LIRQPLRDRPTSSRASVLYDARFATANIQSPKRLENDMGKYLLGWVLGVPVFVLVIAYFFFH
jgi:hypothetical protein